MHAYGEVTGLQCMDDPVPHHLRQRGPGRPPKGRIRVPVRSVDARGRPSCMIALPHRQHPASTGHCKRFTDPGVWPQA